MTVAKDLPAATVHFHEYRYLTGRRLRQIVAKRDAYEAGLAAIIDEGIQDGSFKAVDLKLSTLQILSVLNYAYHWYSPSGRYRPEELGERFATGMLEGLLASPPTASSPKRKKRGSR